MTDYRWTRLTPDDTPAWSDLCNHLAVVDGTEEFLSPEDLAEELVAPHHDPASDTWAVWDGGQMVGFGAAFVPVTLDHDGRARGYLGGGVHEDHRGRGLGTALLDHLEDRALALLAERHPGRPAYLSAGGGLADSSARELLTDRGFALDRYWNLLTRPVGDEPEVPAIDGVDLLSPGPEHEEPVLLAHNLAFQDHYGSGPITPEGWHDHWTSRSARPEVSTIAVARGGGPEGWRDGEVLAYIMVGQWVDRQAYVNLVGTVPHARGRGVAAAALARTLGLAARSGRYDIIELDVDSDSPTGATRLYEKVGFTLKHQTASMRRIVSGG
jgi:GNAT superfamily N-acetyltransferase